MENFWTFLEEPVTMGNVLFGVIGYVIAQFGSALIRAFIKGFKNAMADSDAEKNNN